MSEPPADLDPTTFQLHLDHAKAGYTNAQETIRFIDTKTGILTGVLLVTTGLPFVFLNFLCSDEGKPAKEYLLAHGWTARTMGFFFLLGLLCGILSLMSATNGLMARSPRPGSFRERSILLELCHFILCKLHIRDRANPTVPLTALFPLYPPERTTEAITNFEKLGRAELDRRTLLWDYRLQLETIGNIVYTKLDRNRDAVRWFEIQILSYSIALVIALLAAIFAKGSEPKPAQPAPAKAASTQDGGC
jgi:hypothetical protein